MQPDSMQADVVEYRLSYEGDARERIVLETCADDHSLDVPDDFEAPDWARLAHHQCSNCPLDPAQHVWCPVARNLAWVFSGIQSGRKSWEAVRLEVVTAARTYQVDTTLQRALSSLFGLVCSLSNCPHTRPLRPLGRFHLPVASELESLSRVAAFFVLKGWLQDKCAGGSGQVDLTELETVYANLNILNQHFVRRVRDVGRSDATVNALILLDILARDVSIELDAQLDALNALFELAPAARE